MSIWLKTLILFVSNLQIMKHIICKDITAEASPIKIILLATLKVRRTTRLTPFLLRKASWIQLRKRFNLKENKL